MRANRFLGSGGTLNKVFNCATLNKYFFFELLGGEGDMCVNGEREREVIIL